MIFLKKKSSMENYQPTPKGKPTNKCLCDFGDYSQLCALFATFCNYLQLFAIFCNYALFWCDYKRFSRLFHKTATCYFDAHNCRTTTRTLLHIHNRTTYM